MITAVHQIALNNLVSSQAFARRHHRADLHFSKTNYNRNNNSGTFSTEFYCSRAATVFATISSIFLFSFCKFE